MPVFAATQAMWRELEIRHVPVESPAALALIAELDRTFDNGGALLARFALGYHTTMHWLASRGQWERMGFLDGFLRAGAIAHARPDLGGPS
jgi:hypothetical protein